MGPRAIRACGNDRQRDSRAPPAHCRQGADDRSSSQQGMETVPGGFETFACYGRGPLYVACIMPQDSGNRTGVRWVSLTDHRGAGLLAVGGPVFEAGAHHYTADDFTRALHTCRMKRRDEITLNLDCRQCGLGGNSCGPPAPDKYLVRPEPVASCAASELEAHRLSVRSAAVRRFSDADALTGTRSRSRVHRDRDTTQAAPITSGVADSGARQFIIASQVAGARCANGSAARRQGHRRPAMHFGRRRYGAPRMAKSHRPRVRTRIWPIFPRIVIKGGMSRRLSSLFKLYVMGVAATFENFLRLFLFFT